MRSNRIATKLVVLLYLNVAVWTYAAVTDPTGLGGVLISNVPAE